MFLFGRKLKLPSLHQWTHLIQVLGAREKVVFLISLSVFLTSFTIVASNFYVQNTTIVPTAGGKYVEGVIGQPRFINPMYANSDADRDVVELVFSGLMKYNNNLEIIPDLAESYTLDNNGTIYTFKLKSELFWQDKKPLTADDLVFTVRAVQNPEYKSPLLATWTGVEVEKLNTTTVRFKLEKPYSSFLESATLKIIPKHLWENIPPGNAALEINNNLLRPIGSGPYKVSEVRQGKSNRIESLALTPNPLYYGKRVLVSDFKFVFFDTEQNLAKEAAKKRLDGFSLQTAGNPSKYNVYYLPFPRYFAVFFNPEKSKSLADKQVRLALNYALDKESIIAQISHNGASFRKSALVTSPIMPEIYNIVAPSLSYNFDGEKAKEILDKAGFVEQDNNGVRTKTINKTPAFQFKSDLREGSRGIEVEELQKCLAKFSDVYPEGEITGSYGGKTKAAVIVFQEKYRKEILDPTGLSQGTGTVGKGTRNILNSICFGSSQEIIPLSFTLVTVDQAELGQVADLIKNQWAKIGVNLEIRKYSRNQLEQDFIRTRNYDMIFFGEVLGAIPDPLPFWHSAQVKDPGLNLAMYNNKKVDEVLEELRTIADIQEREAKLAEFQDLLLADSPAVFIYSPEYTYFISSDLKGFEQKKIAEPSKRFLDITNWFMKTKRIWK